MVLSKCVISLIIYCQMSIYSGFATRKDENKYNLLLAKLITLMQNHLLEFIEGATTQSKILSYVKVISKMKQYEEHKYLPPKFSELLEPLCKALGLPVADRITDSNAQLQNEYRNQTDVVDKYSSNSVNKLKMKHKLNTYGLESQQIRRVKKCSMLQQKLQRLDNIPEGRQSKRPVFLSSADLKARKDNAIFQMERKMVPNTEQSQCSQSEDKEVPFRQFRTATHQSTSSKLGKNLRYKAHLALQQAQQNILKRQFPLRAEMRRNLKREPYKDQS